MEQSAVEIDNDQGMQVEEIRESNDISVPQEQTDQSQTMDQNVDVPGHVEATPERKESAVHASTSKVNSIITKELIRGRQILLRKCKTNAKDLLAKLAKGFIPISLELGPKGRRRKRNRRLFICEKRTVRSERTLRRKYNRRPRRCTRCDHSCRTRRKYY